MAVEGAGRIPGFNLRNLRRQSREPDNFALVEDSNNTYGFLSNELTHEPTVEQLRGAALSKYLGEIEGLDSLAIRFARVDSRGNKSALPETRERALAAFLDLKNGMSQAQFAMDYGADSEKYIQWFKSFNESSSDNTPLKKEGLDSLASRFARVNTLGNKSIYQETREIALSAFLDLQGGMSQAQIAMEYGADSEKYIQWFKSFNESSSDNAQHELMQPHKLGASDRVRIAGSAARAFVMYPALRRELLELAGYEGKDLENIMQTLKKSGLMTVTLDMLQGPLLDIAGVYLGLNTTGPALESALEGLSPETKMFIAAALFVGSSALYYGSVRLKTDMVPRLIKEDIKTVPSVSVAAGHFMLDKLITKDERKPLALFLAYFANPSALWDEKWLLTSVFGDHAATVATGNTAGAVFNFSVVGASQLAIYSKRFIKYLKGHPELMQRFVETAASLRNL